MVSRPTLALSYILPKEGTFEFVFIVLIAVSTLIGFVLLGLDQLGMVIGFGMILGCLIRGIYLLKEILARLEE